MRPIRRIFAIGLDEPLGRRLFLNGSAVCGNFTKAKTHFGIDGDVFKLSVGYGADVRAAQMRATANYARTVARDLQQSIKAYLADKARSGSMTDASKQATEEVTQTQSHVEITGHENKGVRTTSKYLKSVPGELPEDLTPDEKDVRDMVKTMMDDARHPTVMTQQEK